MDGRNMNSKNSTKKAPKLKYFNADISPVNPNSYSPYFIDRGINCHRPKSPIFDPYASSPDICFDSPDTDSSELVRYLCLSSTSSSNGSSSSRNRSRSEGRNGGGLFSPFSLACIQDLETPSKTLNVEEDVLVMDGILVDNDKINNRKASSSGRSRSTSSSSGSRGRSGLSTVTSDGNLTNFYEREKRVPREDSGTPRFDSKSNIGQQNVELCSSHLLGKNKSEEKLCKSFISGSCTFGTRCRFFHHLVKSSLPIEPVSTAKSLPRTAATISSITAATNTANNMTASAVASTSDWSPLDDGIEIDLPSASSEKTTSREDANDHIHAVLYVPSGRKRLPVFSGICSE